MNPEAQALPDPPALTSEDKNWGLAVHLSALSGLVLPLPFASIVVPLIIWSVKRHDMPFIEDQGREVLNFQITYLIALIVSGLLIFLLIGIILLPVVYIAGLVLTIVGAIRAHQGEAYRYPLSIRFIQ